MERNVFSPRDWLVLALFSAAAPFVNFYVQLYWSFVAMPMLPVSLVGKSQVLLVLWLSAVNIIGAVFVAVLLALPLALLLRRRPIILALLPATATAFAALWLGTFKPDLSWLLVFTELLALFVLSWALAAFIVRRVGATRYAA